MWFRLGMLALLPACLCTAYSEPRAIILQERIDRALRDVRAILNSTRRPQYPADVPHSYDDKFLLAELTTRAAAAALINLFDSIAGTPGWWAANSEQLLSWSAKGRVVTLSFAACESSVRERSAKRDLDSGSKTVTESLGGLVSSMVKTVTTVNEHFWRLSSTVDLVVFPGVARDEGLTLRHVSSAHTVKTTTSREDEPIVAPWKERHCGPAITLDISWLLARVHAGKTDFAINRTAGSCRTPRRNDDVNAAMGFSQELSVWARQAQSYFQAFLFPAQRDHGLDLGAAGTDEVFDPVLATLSLEKGPGSEARALVGDLTLILTAHKESIAGKLGKFSSLFPEDKGFITSATMTMVFLLHCAERLARDHLGAIDAIEEMLYRQLSSAIGKELSSADFAEYMDFHHRKLFKPALGPGRFSYAVRRPQRSPEGLVSIEGPRLGSGSASGGTVPIQTVAAQKGLGRRMRFALNAAADVVFGGERLLHPLVLHSFAGEPLPKLSLVARARQFSSFVLLLGRVLSSERFEPTAALILKDRDDLIIPLLLETIPTPKEFRDAIGSLSPEQQRFARAFRSMQLSSTLFGLCVIQIKPQMERVLNLPPDSLTKEIQLTQDLMQLFITYQVPSDLLSYDEAIEASGNASKLQVVRDHVSTLLSTINASKQRELEEAQEVARKRELERSSLKYDLSGDDEEWKKDAGDLKKLAGMHTLSLKSYPRMGSHKKRAPASEPAPAPASVPTPAPGPSTASGPATEAGDGEVDYARLPALLDARFEELDEDGTLRPTKVELSSEWSKREAPGLLSPLRERKLRAKEQQEERDRAFDLLDALTRSGALPVEEASLHVVLAATHGFDRTLVDTLVQGSVNPIEKVERSVLIMASTLHGQPPSALVAEDQAERVRRTSPGLFPLSSPMEQTA